jgi:hypothetical protein
MIYPALPIMIAWNQLLASASLLPIALTSQALISMLTHAAPLHADGRLFRQTENVRPITSIRSAMSLALAA